jgi:soluble P-type ATPase
MIKLEIPGWETLRLEHLVLDYNGTLACDGDLLIGVRSRLEDLVKQLQIHVLTADTFGKAHAALNGIQCHLCVLPPRHQDAAKLSYVQKIGSENTACIGNGRNDRLMLKAAALGVLIVGNEGAATDTLMASDVVTPNIAAALDLLLHPLRLVATLRS